MSFLFGKKNKQQGNAPPSATPDITSSHGPGAQAALPNGPPREKDSGRPGLQLQPQPQPQTSTSTPSGSVNNSLSSLHGRDGQGAIAPEAKALRERAGSNEQVRGPFSMVALHVC